MQNELEDVRSVFAIVVILLDERGDINAHELIDFL